MKVYALVGKSGTGKSYQAMNLCKDMNIVAIIDDGLLIYGSSILAGVSAKRQSTKVGAIKTALFTDKEHRASVRDKLLEVNPESVLVLGTSDSMIDRISACLDLPPATKTIYIEQITTASEREIADKQRHQLGKHVIPVPTFQLKRDFSGYFVDTLRIFKNRGGRGGFTEKSVVRPTYSYLGDYTISNKVITDIISHIGASTAGVTAVIKVNLEVTKIGIDITILVMMKYGYRVIEVGRELQRRITYDVEAMTAFNIHTVAIEVRGLI